MNQIKDPHFHYLSMAAANHANEDRVSQISIESVRFSNWDPHAYTDKEELKSEAIVMALEQANVKKQENGEYHPSDLMSHKIKMHM